MADSEAKPIKHQEWGQSWQGKHYIKPSYSVKAVRNTKLEAKTFPV